MISPIPNVFKQRYGNDDVGKRLGYWIEGVRGFKAFGTEILHYEIQLISFLNIWFSLSRGKWLQVKGCL